MISGDLMFSMVTIVSNNVHLKFIYMESRSQVLLSHTEMQLCDEMGISINMIVGTIKQDIHILNHVMYLK
jgi:hypothetical protein